MHITRGEMLIIVFMALIAIVYAIYDVDIRFRERGINKNDIIEINIPETPRVEDSFYQGTVDESVINPEKDNNVQEPQQYKPNPNVISSKAYLVGNLRTGEIYASQNSRSALPIASMSKLMTAYVATEILTSTTTIEITKENTEVYPDASNLTEGEKFTLDMILYPLLLNSSNVAAEAIATNYGRADFLELMSSYAWEIGLPSSFFSDPSGLSPNNKASAGGFFELTKFIYETKRDLFNLTKNSELEVSTTTEHNSHKFTNTHPYVKDPRFIGGKTGRTPEAGDTMLTILNIGGDPIAFIVLGGAYDRRKADTDLLILKLEKILSESDIIRPTL